METLKFRDILRGRPLNDSLNLLRVGVNTLLTNNKSQKKELLSKELTLMDAKIEFIVPESLKNTPQML